MISRNIFIHVVEGIPVVAPDIREGFFRIGTDEAFTAKPLYTLQRIIFCAYLMDLTKIFR